jgi:hypothetical protein
MTATPATSVRFGRLERRGVLLGLDVGQLTLLAVALVVLVVAEYGAGALGVAVTAPVWGALASVALVSVAGRPVTKWLPIVGQWMVRRAFRATRYVARPLREPRSESLSLPGFPGRLTIAASPVTAAAVIFDRRSATVTGILELAGRGFPLEDAGSQDLRVSGWGRVLASLCQQPEIVRIQLLHRSSADGAAGVRRWWAEQALADAPWAARVVADLLAESSMLTDRRDCFLAVAVRVPRGSRRVTAATVSALDQHLAAITDGLASAEVDVLGVVTPARLRQVLRTAYDPIAASDSAHVGSGAGLVGPMGVAEFWDCVRTDAAHHAVYWVAEWPRSDVHPGFLHPLLLAAGARRAFALIAEPLSASAALREIRRARGVHAAGAAQRARIGRVEDESTRAEAADLVRREQDLVGGHGDLRFAGLITVSAGSRAELEVACRATEAAAAQAMCELRLLVGQQGQAHAVASLPLARGLL